MTEKFSMTGKTLGMLQKGVLGMNVQCFANKRRLKMF